MDKAKRRDSQHHLQAFDSFEVYHDARVQRVRVENLGLGAHMQINIVYIDGRTARVPCTKWQPIQIENTVAYYNRLEGVYRAYVTNR